MSETVNVLGLFNITANDVDNHMQIAAWLQQSFRAQLFDKQSTWDLVSRTLQDLVQMAADMPALALGVAMALYSYFWWEGPQSVSMNVKAALDATSQFYRSILHNGCDSEDLSLDGFVARHCNLRWRHLLMVAGELGRYLAVNTMDVQLGAALLRDATGYMQHVRRLPFFSRYDELGPVMHKPHDTNFNQDFFPHLPFGPVWPNAEVPLAAFLEQHVDDFVADLRGILHDDAFETLHMSNRNAGSHYREFGPREDDWQTIYFVRSGLWNDLNCQAARTTCALLRSRPEISKCAVGNSGAGFLRLRPGGRVKPHFGNAPRLAAHLGLIVPERGDIHMMVGGRRITWQTGKTIVFDDTFVHSVSHDGDEPRYVLNVWFCHPCDAENSATGEPVTESCKWPEL